MPAPTVAGVAIKAPWDESQADILSAEALEFLAALHREFNARRLDLLAAREARAQRIKSGDDPDFLPDTAEIRAGDWRIDPLPEDLLDRRVEITGPVDRKMVINALNSGAKVFMADFEDSSTPTWANMIDGQRNLADAVRRAITFDDPNSGKHYQLGDRPAVLKVRPRGWHLPESHLEIDGAPASGSLVDFGLFFFHNAKEQLARNTGPYFYLPKLESHLEARLWNDVFVFAQDRLGVPQGSVKATVLIETILAAFEMDEILFELRRHSAGLNCGRWDYIFSYIKKFAHDPGRVLPNRSAVTMTVPMMRAYSLLAIKTCHKRGAPAICGMAAFIPIKSDPQANEEALAKVRADKKREAGDGHDGSWVAHPGLVPIAIAEFDAVLGDKPNQIDRQREDVQVSAADLLAVPEGPLDRDGLYANVAIGIGYLEAWLRGIGCVPLFNLMEDAATAEISRAQIWQWLRHHVRLDDGTEVTEQMLDTAIAEELDAWRERVGEDAFQKGRFVDAATMFRELSVREDFVTFLTLPAYDRVVQEGG